MAKFPESPYIESTLSPDARKIAIDGHFRKILELLGLDLTDDSLMDTPRRVAKMYVDEIFSGLPKENFPKITVQENKFGYNQMLIETNIAIRSVCEHHFVPIIGNCHIGYIPGKKVIGLSKLNRVADYYARRPQVQERLTEQIRCKLVDVLDTEDVIVTIDAVHYCVVMRGIKDTNAITRTTSMGGSFEKKEPRIEFLNAIGTIKKL